MCSSNWTRASAVILPVSDRLPVVIWRTLLRRTLDARAEEGQLPHGDGARPPFENRSPGALWSLSILRHIVTDDLDPHEHAVLEVEDNVRPFVSAQEVNERHRACPSQLAWVRGQSQVGCRWAG